MSVYPEGAIVRRHARLDPTGSYRYVLGREWGMPVDRDPVSLAFIMLNPSTADAEQDDPTVRKCVGFARRLGYDAIVVMNLFAYRATDPAELKRALRAGVDVVGPQTDTRLQHLLAARCSASEGVVAAWGAHAPADRVRQILRMPGSRALCTLGLTAQGVPRHPLMLGYEGATLKPLLS